ncbi:hypothetical protein DYB26_003020 [Aphanomyces astaci]|uniref:Uncharacterized protein n=1 Tax=Aphanomyces astaci TaxID=112090 RepID=A0A397CWJ5_APHAT|nr:hypothetical protein DYB38_004966 [Aphanomyces astaci]RHZ04739.1 hypothetical protein DYB26_003020 [Aphanomyces astaci]
MVLYSLSQNPGILALGLATLAGALERNASLTCVKFTPNTSDIAQTEPLATLLQLTEANAALGTMKKALTSFNFAALSPFAQVNFVNKLDACTETELRSLLTNQSFVQCKLSAGQLCALQYYASLDMYTPLRRLLWAYDALHRQEAARLAASVPADDDELAWQESLVDLPPLRST